MVEVGELACFGGMPTGRLGVGSAFAKASGDSEVRFQLSANLRDLSTNRLQSVCYGCFCQYFVSAKVLAAQTNPGK